MFAIALDKLIQTLINRRKYMNFYIKSLCRPRAGMAKILLVMRLIVVILTTAILQVSASSFAQSITLSEKNATLEYLLKRIKRQTGYDVLYADNVLAGSQKITVNLADVPLADALNKILTLASHNLAFELEKKIIIIKEKEKNRVFEPVRPIFKIIDIKGRVLDHDGKPIEGVSILVKGKTTATSTNSQGDYFLKGVAEDAILLVSFTGMETQEISVEGRTTINVSLKDKITGMDEIVVVGYGSQKRESLIGSVATIRSKDLTVAPVASTTNALVGRLPGLIAKQESGLPGGDASSLSIRGFGAPLVIVDGIQSSFNNIDPNEIESISILKDASAAIYGARAGDGVILVTTKRGTSDKPTISLQSSATFQGVTSMPKMGSSGQMAELFRETQFNQGVPESQMKFSKEQIKKYYEGTDPEYPNTDWWGVVGRDWSPESQHNLSLTGGSDKIKYYGFLGYMDQQSFFKKNGPEYKRYNLRSNIDAKILDNLTLQFDLASIVENKDYPARFYDQYAIWQEYWNSEPFWSATLPDAQKIPYAGAGGAIGIHFQSNSELSGYRKTNSQNLKGSLSLKYDFKAIKGLSTKAFVNYHQNYTFLKAFSWLSDSWSYNNSNDTYTQRTFATQPALIHQDLKDRTMTGQFSLNFDRTIANDHQISALALYEVIDYYSDWIQAKRIGYKSTSIEYLFAGGLANQSADGSASEMGRQSLIGRLNYAYKAKYLLEGTLRVDESAKFDPQHRRGYFPSISLGWRVSEENFIKKSVPFIDNLKLRLSYSETGKDDVANFAYLAGYRSGEPYLIGSATSNGLLATGIANPNLTWESMKIYNAGLDFGFLKNSLYGELDVFYRDRNGIPGQRVVSLPDTYGANLPFQNLNSINTRGFEFLLGYKGGLRDLSWDVKANISWSRSKWGYYDEPEYEDPDQRRQMKLTGQWTDRTFGYISDGVFTSQDEINALDFAYTSTNGNTALRPGDIRYKEYEKDGLLDWRDMAEIGKGTTPHWIGGLNIGLKYKAFDMSALFQGAWGYYSRIRLRWGNNFSELMFNERWTPENNKKDILIERLGGPASNGLSSDFYYKKGDYVRLKILSLGYNLPASLLKKINIRSIRLYGAATNLFTLSGLMKYDIDPEAPSGYGGSYYPQMRTLSFGLNLTL